jgi:PPE-repeat protein
VAQSVPAAAARQPATQSAPAAAIRPAINPPESQLAPAVQEASAELAQSLAEPAAAPRGRGRPAKATLPETGVAPKIKTLYVNCGPVGVDVPDAGQLIVLAKKIVAEQGIADYRFAEYGQGPGMLVVAVVGQLDALEGILPALRLDTTTPEGSVIAVELMARAELVVRA